jgi:TRAP-type C4-dicarboxylate transport system permease small subunit
VTEAAEDTASAAWRLLELIAGLLIGAITVLVTVQVFARYVLNNTPPWSEELCRYLFVWVSFLGACVATRRAAHLGVDSLVSRLPTGAREVLRHAVSVLIVVFTGLLVWQGAALVPAMASQRSPSMAISLQYVFVAIPIAGVIMLTLQLRTLARDRAAPGLRTGVALALVAAVAVVLTGRLVAVSPSAAVIALIATMALLIAVHMPIAFAVGCP